STYRQSPAQNPMKRWRGFAVAAVILGAAAVIGPRLLTDRPVQGAAQPPAPLVTVSQALQKEIHGRLQLLGQFSAVDQVELRAQVGGTLTHIGFKDGQIVRKGALLFIIDPTPYKIKFDEGTAQAENARARLGLATTELKRAQTLQ